MEFNILLGLLHTDEDKVILSNLSNDRLDKPVLLQQLIDILSDKSPYIRHISSDKILSLFRMTKEYFDKCWGFYLDSTMGEVKLDKLIQFSERIIYHTITPDGTRVSTDNEVKNGIMELEPQIIKNIPDDITEHLNLLLWTFTGQLRYYKRAGLSYTYEEGTLKDTTYDIVVRAGRKLRDMIDWISVRGNYERAIAALKIGRKNNKYVYPVFANNEITPDIPTKQLYYLCDRHIPWKTVTENQDKARKLVYRVKRENYKPLPYEISIMRKAYKEILDGNVANTSTDLPEEIVELCNLILVGKEQGIIKHDSFALKVVSTVKKSGRCSDRQLNVLKNAEKDINKAILPKNKDTGETVLEPTDDSMQELFAMSEALGSGVLEV